MSQSFSRLAEAVAAAMAGRRTQGGGEPRPNSTGSVSVSSFPSEVTTRVPEELRGYDRENWQEVDPYEGCEDKYPCRHDLVMGATLDELWYR